MNQWKILSPAQAVHKMTGLPAEILGLADRGTLRDGAAADITIIEPEKFSDQATYDNPAQPPAGVRCTMVNGQIVWQDGKHTGARSGEFLRHSRTTNNS